MGLPRKIDYVILGLVLIAAVGIILTVAALNAPHGKWLIPVKVVDQPAGIEYEGPQTTAIAGWYCILSLNATPLPGPCGEPIPTGYSIQLNALLSNGAWVQALMVPAQCSGSGCTSNYVWTYRAQYWVGNTTANSVTLPSPVRCGWLIITVWHGTAYVGYSTSWNGENVTWFSSYPVGNATIVPGAKTNLVLAGPGYGEGLNLTASAVDLGLYYWDGTAWTPAPVSALNQSQALVSASGWVQEAWVLANTTCGGSISWPTPPYATACITGPLSFSPYPG